MEASKNRIGLLTLLISILVNNAMVVVGVLYLGWNFFMVLYAYWFGEAISSFFDFLTERRYKKGGFMSLANEEESRGRFFFLGIYWVFIVVLVGFVTAPVNSYGENLRVLFFLNKTFDLNLFAVFAGLLLHYVQKFYFTKNHIPSNEEIKALTLMNKRTVVMHVSIIFGTFAWFAANTDKFFFKLDLGEYGPFGFMIVFVVIRFVGDVLGFYRALKL